MSRLFVWTQRLLVQIGVGLQRVALAFEDVLTVFDDPADD